MTEKEILTQISRFSSPLFYKRIFSNWHKYAPEEKALKDGQDGFSGLITADCYYNFVLWHAEDEARRTDVKDRVIVDMKHSIDRNNQKRNDIIEKIDAFIQERLQESKGYLTGKRHNTETPGNIIDRLCILGLKIFHMGEEAVRKNAGRDHNRRSKEKLEILLEQQADLYHGLLELLQDYLHGRRSLKLFHQFKMYNDPSLNPALYKTLK